MNSDRRFRCVSFVWIDLYTHGFNYLPRIYRVRKRVRLIKRENDRAVTEIRARRIKINKIRDPRSFIRSAKAMEDVLRRVLENSHDKSRLQSWRGDAYDYTLSLSGHKFLQRPLHLRALGSYRYSRSPVSSTTTSGITVTHGLPVFNGSATADSE